jgi:hypothetical protein
MTLLETERLIRKINELLLQSGGPDAPRISESYAAARHAVNIRLQQCEAMIRANDRHQAIQLAETEPNLLEFIKLLEFANSENWRSFCQQNSLAIPERIDAEAIKSLKQCYAQGISTDHPLYAAFRKAALMRNDEEALNTLRSITRLNPTDSNAAAELTRLDAKVLAAKLDHLNGTAQGSDAALVATETEAIEAYGFKTRPEGDVWRKANLIRCGVLLDQAAAAKAAAQWREVLAKAELARRLQKDLSLEFSANQLQQLEALEKWGKAEQEKDRQNREFAALLSHLQQRIHESEEKDTSARYVELPEMRADFEALHKVWRALTDFTRPIPEDATAAFRKRSGLLEGEIARRMAVRRRLLVAGVSSVLLVGVIAAWFILGQIKAAQRARELESAISHRQTHTAENLLDDVQKNKRLLSSTKVRIAVADTQSFLGKEHELLSNFESAFAQLPTQLGGEPDAARVNAIAGQLAQARAALAALSPDLKEQNVPRLNKFEGQWQEYLSESAVTVNSLFEQWVTGAEKQSSQLDYNLPLDKASQGLSKISEVMQKIDQVEAGFTNQLQLRSDLLQRAAAVHARFDAYQGELKKIDEGLASLKQAHTFDEFSSAISHIASSEFSTTPAATAAAEIQSLGASEEAVLRSLIGATNPATWAFIRKSKPLNLTPELVMPAEKSIFQQLNADPAVNGDHRHYRLWLTGDGTKTVDWVTAGALDTATGWKQIKAWEVSADATNAVFQDHDYGYFAAQWKLSPTQPIYRLEELPAANATATFTTADLGKIWQNGDTYSGPLLKALDTIKNSNDGSAIFRAYLLCRLVDVMAFQPDGWGLPFCPSLRAHLAQIHQIVGGQIASGDWFVDSKIAAWNDRLAQFLASVKAVSYAREASDNLALAQAVARDGLHYAGFVSLDGKPVITTGQSSPEVWGYDSARKQPALLTGSGLPLSPLFGLPVPRAEYLAKAGIEPASQPIANTLLPLFRANN